MNQNNQNQLISVSHDGSLRIWDLRKFQCLQELLVSFVKIKKLKLNFFVKIHRKKYDEAVHCVTNNRNLPYVFTGGADACIKVLKSI